MVSLVEDFNSISLHAPELYPHVMEIYKDVEGVVEKDNRGFTIQRPLFSTSDIAYFIGIPTVLVNNFDWNDDAIYPVLLHHNNLLALENLNLIPSYILEKVRERKCKLIIDNLLEGGRIDTLLPTFYKSLNDLNIPYSQVYYITNNLIAEQTHTEYIKQAGIDRGIYVFSFMYNVHDVKRLTQTPIYRTPFIQTENEKVVPPELIPALPTTISIEEEIKYKELNFHKLKLFLKVNRTNREERNLFMLFLNRNKILEKCYISYPDFPSYNNYPDRFSYLLDEKNVQSLKDKLPFDIDESDRSNHGLPGFGLNEFDADLAFNPIHYKNTFISLVMCAFPFEENACHLHSSTFNPMYCGHPVIQFGPYQHLKELKRRGFKTFDKWWDESYDNIQDPWDRFNAVMLVVLQLSILTPEQALQMYIEMKDVLQHNSDLISKYNDIKKLKTKIIYGKEVF